MDGLLTTTNGSKYVWLGGSLVFIVLLSFLINHLQRAVAAPEKLNPCTNAVINGAERTACLNYIEQRVLQSIAKTTLDDYSMDTRISLLQALALMHCPAVEKP